MGVARQQVAEVVGRQRVVRPQAQGVAIGGHGLALVSVVGQRHAEVESGNPVPWHRADPPPPEFHPAPPRPAGMDRHPRPGNNDDQGRRERRPAPPGRPREHCRHQDHGAGRGRVESLLRQRALAVNGQQVCHWPERQQRPPEAEGRPAAAPRVEDDQADEQQRDDKDRDPAERLPRLRDRVGPEGVNRPVECGQEQHSEVAPDGAAAHREPAPQPGPGRAFGEGHRPGALRGRVLIGGTREGDAPQRQRQEHSSPRRYATLVGFAFVPPEEGPQYEDGRQRQDRFFRQHAKQETDNRCGLEPDAPPRAFPRGTHEGERGEQTEEERQQLG